MNDEKRQIGWRIKVGFAMLVVSISWPVLIPILPLLGASTVATATFTGVMVIAAELLLLGGAAVAGKEGFALIKGKAFGFLKSFGPAREVGRLRYTVGLVLFAIPLVFGWAAAYFGNHIPGFEQGQLIYAIVGDVLLLLSLFMLGGAFWDKLRSLFMHNAYAVIPDKPAAEHPPV